MLIRQLHPMDPVPDTSRRIRTNDAAVPIQRCSALKVCNALGSPALLPLAESSDLALSFPQSKPPTSHSRHRIKFLELSKFPPAHFKHPQWSPTSYVDSEASGDQGRLAHHHRDLLLHSL